MTFLIGKSKIYSSTRMETYTVIHFLIDFTASTLGLYITFYAVYFILFPVTKFANLFPITSVYLVNENEMAKISQIK